MKEIRSRRRAFTLIEVLLVIVILGMLATVAVVTLSGTREGAKIDTTKLTLDKLRGSLERYNSHVGQYPTEEEGGLQALTTLPTFEDEATAEKWRGPYAESEDLTDEWGNEFQYELVEQEVGTRTQLVPRISSMGPDGLEGTDDDIKSWDDEEEAF
jgi:general secretion pathway protein G